MLKFEGNLYGLLWSIDTSFNNDGYFYQKSVGKDHQCIMQTSIMSCVLSPISLCVDDYKIVSSYLHNIKFVDG